MYFLRFMVKSASTSEFRNNPSLYVRIYLSDNFEYLVRDNTLVCSSMSGSFPSIVEVVRANINKGGNLYLK